MHSYTVNENSLFWLFASAMDPTTTPTPMEAPTTTAGMEALPTLLPLEDPEDPARNRFSCNNVGNWLAYHEGLFYQRTNEPFCFLYKYV